MAEVTSPTVASALPSWRWSPYEIGFWLMPIAAFFAFPNYLTLGSQILIAGLFALSLDLILGYARIISLGHAAFFGLGAYTAGLLARHGFGEPLSGLFAAAAVAAIAGWITSFLIVRGQDLTRLMVTLVLGGSGYLCGGLLGAGVFMILQDYLANLNPVYWQFWLGLLLVLIVLFARGGLMGGLVALHDRLRRRSV